MNKNKGIILIVVGVLLLCVVGASFAYFSVSGTQDNPNTFSSGCFSVSIENESSAISLSNTIPTSDADGKNGTPYQFTVSNTCNKTANYQLSLESLNQTTNTLSADYIQVLFSSDTETGEVKTLGTYATTTPTLSGSYAAHNLYSGTMAGNTTKVFYLRLWLKESATISQAAGKTYTSKINLTATSV